MLEIPVIQGRGFRNVVQDGRTTGFQFQLRNPNYRGFAASLLDGIDVIVDGEKIPSHVPLWTLQGRTVDLDQLRESVDLRWQLDELATITVPRPGGLDTGVHRLEIVVHLRRSYFPPAVSRTPFTTERSMVIVPDAPEGGLKFGVSTYSYTGDIYSTMTLDDVMADVADMGATGFEILGEGNIPSYPNPDPTWIEHWRERLDTLGLTPNNYGSWVDTTRWHDRALTVEEGAAQLQTDLRLAHRLGFDSVRPKFGVVSWNLDPHPIWSDVVERSLELAAELDVVICPEIHAPTPIDHPVTQGYIDFIERTGSDHFKLLIDTGIFNTAPVLEMSEEVEIGDGGDIPPHLRPLAVPISDLVAVLPHVHFVQAKFAEVDDTLTDMHVPWAEIIPALQDAGWNGWLSSEYEGRREPYRGNAQVRRSHALLRTLASRR